MVVTAMGGTGDQESRNPPACRCGLLDGRPPRSLGAAVMVGAGSLTGLLVGAACPTTADSCRRPRSACPRVRTKVRMASGDGDAAGVALGDFSGVIAKPKSPVSGNGVGGTELHRDMSVPGKQFRCITAG